MNAVKLILGGISAERNRNDRIRRGFRGYHYRCDPDGNDLRGAFRLRQNHEQNEILHRARAQGVCVHEGQSETKIRRAWFAAFHNEDHHPHIHMILYSTDKSYGYLSKEGVQNLRSTLGKEIFAQDLLTKYKEQTAHRDSLRSKSKELVAQIIAQINEGNYDNPVLESKLIELSKILSETVGKKVYGYLNAETKALVDEIVDELADDERLSQLYELW